MKKLTGKHTLFLYALSGMGINLLNMVIGSYLCDALMTSGFDKNIEHWTYLNKTLVVPAVWAVMITISKIVDGIIDIPLAAWTDRLHSRFGRRRPPILIGMVGVIAAYVLFLIPLQTTAESLLNTFWFGFLLCVFYTMYTMTMVTYYATFAEIVQNEPDRVRLSNYKSTFDIVYFVLGYALIPALIDVLNIRAIALILLPLSMTMLIPLFLIKEHSTKEGEGGPDADIPSDEGETVNLGQSLRYTFQNRKFVLWMVVYAALQFGLQIFLTGMNVFFSGAMEMRGIYLTAVMACAFIPVPLTLMLYNRLVRRYGFRTGFLFSVGVFMAGMALMFVSYLLFPGAEAFYPRLALACVGALVASFGIGSFFSVSYTIPSALAEEERREKGVSHPAMYFAIQGLSSGIATAIATGLVWVNLKAWNDGEMVFLMPVIVIAAAAVAFGLAFTLPVSLGKLGQEQPAPEIH